MAHAFLYAILPLTLLLRFLVEGFLSLIGSPLAAIVLLSLSVRLIMVPFSRLADHWQRQVNEKKTLLEPGLAALKKEYRGEELHNRTLALYKEKGISLFYAFKSLFGAAIQIPFFFAAFHALSESTRFAGLSFLWISDLGRPDAFWPLPFALPWFGDSLNILPLIMTILTLVASRITVDHSLSWDMLRRQRRSLYGMAGFFFILLYPFASAMVLYWTVNNLISLGWALRGRHSLRVRPPVA